MAFSIAFGFVFVGGFLFFEFSYENGFGSGFLFFDSFTFSVRNGVGSSLLFTDSFVVCFGFGGIVSGFEALRQMKFVWMLVFGLKEWFLLLL
jgi:hypothetical protein